MFGNTIRAAAASAGLALVMTAGCASAPETPAPTATATEPAAAQTSPIAADAALNEVVCRNEHNIGTRFARKLCKTRREWLRDQWGQESGGGGSAPGSQ